MVDCTWIFALWRNLRQEWRVVLVTCPRNRLRGGKKRHFNQSILVLLCPMFGLLQEVLAAWAALLPRSSLRHGSERSRVPGSRSNCVIFAQPTRIACLLRLHCA